MPGLRSASLKISTLPAVGGVVICAAAAALWFLTGKGMFALILAGGVYRCFTKDQIEKGDNQILLHFLGLMAALGVVSMTGVRPPPDA